MIIGGLVGLGSLSLFFVAGTIASATFQITRSDPQDPGTNLVISAFHAMSTVMIVSVVVCLAFAAALTFIGCHIRKSSLMAFGWAIGFFAILVLVSNPTAILLVPLGVYCLLRLCGLLPRRLKAASLPDQTI